MIFGQSWRFKETMSKISPESRTRILRRLNVIGIVSVIGFGFLQFALYQFLERGFLTLLAYKIVVTSSIPLLFGVVYFVVEWYCAQVVKKMRGNREIAPGKTGRM